MKKKILFVVEAMGGGVFTYIVDLANELVEHYDMYIAYAVRPQTPSDYKAYFDERIELIEVKNFERAINPLKDIKALFEIKNIANKVQPDIIHLHSSKAGVIGRIALNSINIPVFYTPHGYSFLMKNYSKLKRKVYLFIENICSKMNCKTISCSKGEHKETIKFTSNAVYVNNGINIKELNQLINNTTICKSNDFTVFTLGRICHQKNPEFFNKVAEKLPDVNFVWIGDGGLKEQLTSSNIKITGWADRNKALQYSQQGDVFVLTSLWEGLPMSLLEAMYMKKMCIVTNVIGNRDVIHNGYNGFVCDSVEEFVDSIKKIQKGECKEYLDNAYEDILKIYNTHKMAEQYSEIYEESIKI